MGNDSNPRAQNQAAISVVRPRTANIAGRMNKNMADHAANGVPSDRAAASSNDQLPDSVARALLSDEAGQAWLANLLQEQRRASERQIMNQHEMLREHFSATLQACMRPITQVLASGAAPKGSRRRDSWDPDNWELEFDGGGRMLYKHGDEDTNASDCLSTFDLHDGRSTTSSLQGNGNGKVNEAKAAVPKAAATPKAPTGTADRSSPSNGSKAKESKAVQKSSGMEDEIASRIAERTPSSTRKEHPVPHFVRYVEHHQEEPEPSMFECMHLGEKSRVEWFMGQPLDFLAVFLIIANTICMIVNSMWSGYRIRVELGLEADGSWQGAKGVFEVSEVAFTLLFLSELVLRLWWNGLPLLKDPLNAVDAFVVAITTLDSFVFSRFDFKAGISAIRLIRMVKLGKTFRFAKALKMVEPLRILVKTIAASVSSLVWSMCILFLFMLVAAILTSQMIQGFIADETNDMSMRLWCEHHYGNVLKALWTMFMITMSGGWPNWVSPLVHEVSLWYAILFGTYVTLVVFAVIRVITALFLKETLAQAAKDADQLFKEKMKKKTATMAKLTEIFHLADHNADNVLSEQEFNSSLHNPTIEKLFYELEMEPSDLEGIFHLLDDGNAQVELDEFLSGIMKMKGLSRATDLLILQHDNRKMLAAVQALEDQTLKAVQVMQADMKAFVKLDQDLQEEMHHIEHEMHDIAERR